MPEGKTLINPADYLRRQSVQFGLVRDGAVPLSAAAVSASRDVAAVSGGAA